LTSEIPCRIQIASHSQQVLKLLRPISKDKKFSGGDVARAQGDGLMFDAIWTFQISDTAE
jgi:hypothetical protein